MNYPISMIHHRTLCLLPNGDIELNRNQQYFLKTDSKSLKPTWKRLKAQRFLRWSMTLQGSFFA